MRFECVLLESEKKSSDQGPLQICSTRWARFAVSLPEVTVQHVQVQAIGGSRRHQMAMS